MGVRIVFLFSFFSLLFSTTCPCFADNWLDICRRRIALTIGAPAAPANFAAPKHTFGYGAERLSESPYDSVEASKARQQLSDLIKNGDEAIVDRTLVTLGSDRIHHFFFWFPNGAHLIALTPIFGSSFVEAAIANKQPEILHVLLKHGFRLNSPHSEHTVRVDALKNLDLPEIKSVFERQALR